MRLWSLHPKYLDSKGLVALWRETLLAKNVLLGKTTGYINHPQLERFKIHKSPIKAIDFYLTHIWIEADARLYNFNKSKFKFVNKIEQINVNSGQINFEIGHLRNKIMKRDPQKYQEIILCNEFEIHPLFVKIKGKIETWEKV